MLQALQGAPSTPENTPGQGGFLGMERYFPKECSGSVLLLFLRARAVGPCQQNPSNPPGPALRA